MFLRLIVLSIRMTSTIIYPNASDDDIRKHKLGILGGTNVLVEKKMNDRLVRGAYPE